MSTSSIGGSGSIDGWRDLHRHRQTGKAGAADAFALDPATSAASGKDASAESGGVGGDEPSSDTLSIDMPNGFKVSGTHLGGNSAFSAQLLGSMEDMIGFLNGLKPAGGGGTGAASSDGGASGVGAASGSRCLDTFHTDLGDGEGLTVHYGTEKDGGNTDVSAMQAMADAIQQIVGKYKSYKQPDLADLYGQVGALNKENA